jgi:hypothetical protein
MTGVSTVFSRTKIVDVATGFGDTVIAAIPVVLFSLFRAISLPEKIFLRF